jgi:hypothetical protein
VWVWGTGGRDAVRLDATGLTIKVLDLPATFFVMYVRPAAGNFTVTVRACILPVVAPSFVMVPVKASFKAPAMAGPVTTSAVPGAAGRPLIAAGAFVMTFPSSPTSCARPQYSTTRSAMETLSLTLPYSLGVQALRARHYY